MDYSKIVHLLHRIQQLQFVTTELNLFLDTHPDDQQALSMYNKVRSDLMEAVREYEKNYGPLLNYGFSSNMYDYWKWIETPWPWDIKY